MKIEKYDGQHGAMMALAILGAVDNLSTILTLGRYCLSLEEKALSFDILENATFLSVFIALFKSLNRGA